MTTSRLAALPQGGQVRPRDDKPVLGWFDEARTCRLESVGRGVLRYGMLAMLLLFGAMKFTKLEADGIQPLLDHSPFMHWMLGAFGVQGASNVIGVVELTTALLIAMRRFKPVLSAVGSLLASVTFMITLSFLFTTPGVTSPDNPLGGFLMKDVMLLGAALYTAAEALSAARRAK